MTFLILCTRSDLVLEISYDQDTSRNRKFWFWFHHHHHHPFNVRSGIVHVSVGKDMPNYFPWNEKLQVSIRSTIRLNKTASLDFNRSIGLGLHFTAGCLSCHKQSLRSLCRTHGGTWWSYEPDIIGQHHWATTDL